MNTICPQCGSVLADGLHACNFCESSEVLPLQEEPSQSGGSLASGKQHDAWRGELNQRLQAYRAKRRKVSPNALQSALPFDQEPPPVPSRVVVQEATEEETPKDDFAFTIAIGRITPKQPSDDRVLIDVSHPPELEEAGGGAIAEQVLPAVSAGLGVASLEQRRNALLVDAGCLAFAYGSFLALFGSLGGHFTLSKLSAAVCAFTFAFVYVQYFGLFTVFGGSTPGMMISGLQVASITGDSPTPRQYVLRAIGYMLSAGTCFLGFLWVLWDEDGLTWHDRISQTYLTSVENLAEQDASHPAAAR